MGVARARVVEVHAPSSAARQAGSGYLIGDRFVLTAADVAGGHGPSHVRQAGAATWLASALVWAAPPGGAAVLELDDPSAVMVPPERTRWGRVTGSRPVPVTGMGFAPSATRPEWPRDPQQFLGQVAPGPHSVTMHAGGRPAGAGMSGAALFAGAELVGVLLATAERLRAVPVPAEDDGFVALFGAGGELALTPVSASSSGFPILPV